MVSWTRSTAAYVLSLSLLYLLLRASFFFFSIFWFDKWQMLFGAPHPPSHTFISCVSFSGTAAPLSSLYATHVRRNQNAQHSFFLSFFISKMASNFFFYSFPKPNPKVKDDLVNNIWYTAGRSRDFGLFPDDRFFGYIYFGTKYNSILELSLIESFDIQLVLREDMSEKS